MPETIENSPAPKPSDVMTRVKTAVPLAVIIIGVMAYGSPFWVGLVVLAFSLVGIVEYASICEKAGVFLNKPILFLGTLALGVGTLLGGQVGLDDALLLTCTFCFFYYLLFSPTQTLGDLQELGLVLLGLLLIAWTMNHITLLKSLPEGTALLFFIVLIVWVNDIAAYFGGRSFGKNKLAPSISPKKTLEGSAFGLLGAGLVGGLYAALWLDSLNWWSGALLGGGLAVFGQMGDLVESKLKRICNVKDSGTIFPGHGGVLDRVDAFLTTAPAFYYLMYWLTR